MEIITFKPFDPREKKIVEKIFDVNLEDRDWRISSECGESNIVITFWNKDEEISFGYMSRLSINDFMTKLIENNLYLNINSSVN